MLTATFLDLQLVISPCAANPLDRLYRRELPPGELIRYLSRSLRAVSASVRALNNRQLNPISPVTSGFYQFFMPPRPAHITNESFFSAFPYIPRLERSLPDLTNATPAQCYLVRPPSSSVLFSLPLSALQSEHNGRELLADGSISRFTSVQYLLGAYPMLGEILRSGAQTICDPAAKRFKLQSPEVLSSACKAFWKRLVRCCLSFHPRSTGHPL
jgi:hypothetical protein